LRGGAYVGGFLTQVLAAALTSDVDASAIYQVLIFRIYFIYLEND
jgi:hypothetical protein